MTFIYLSLLVVLVTSANCLVNMREPGDTEIYYGSEHRDRCTALGIGGITIDVSFKKVCNNLIFLLYR